MSTMSPTPLVGNNSKDTYMAEDFEAFTTEDLPDFTTVGDLFDNHLEGIDYYDDLFVGFDGDDVLPDLEFDWDIDGEFSGSGREEEQEMEGKTSTASEISVREGGGSKQEGGGGGDGGVKDKTVRRAKRKGKKIADCSSDGNIIMKKPKVDWTPELHRIFVHAVEHLGIDKAVPSRILKLMNVNFLTRHNVASHLQKYRTHRKNLLAREAEAVSWNFRRHATVAVAGGGKKPWTTPTLGYPPHMAPMHHGHVKPLHVWGHPPNTPVSAHQTYPIPAIAAAPSSWNQQPLYPQGYGIASPCHSNIGVLRRTLGLFNPPTDIYPSNEIIDAAIGEVIAQPWLPFPLGLKTPSVDGLTTELQRQGLSNVPPLP